MTMKFINQLKQKHFGCKYTTEEDGTVVIRNMGFDYQNIIKNKKYDQIIVTSYTEQDGERHHARKVVLKGII